MPVSKPTRWVTFRFTAEEKAALERLATERNVTMTWAIKEGVRLQLRDLRSKVEQASDDESRVVA